MDGKLRIAAHTCMWYIYILCSDVLPVLLYADNTKILTPIKSPSNGLELLGSWLDQWKLSFKISKYIVTRFSKNKDKVDFDYSLQVC